MDINAKNSLAVCESGLHETLTINNDDSTDTVMRSPSKKQGLSTPSQSNRKDKLSKSSPKKSDEKDVSKQKTHPDKSPNRSLKTSGMRRSRLSRDSNEGGASRARSASSGVSRGRSSSLTKLQDEQYDSSPNRGKKQTKDVTKRGRRLSKSKGKPRTKSQSPTKDSPDKTPAKVKGKRGRPVKQNYSRENIAKSIERVIEKYSSYLSSNAKKISKPSPKKQLNDLPKVSTKRPRTNSEIKSPEIIPAKKRGRPKGSKNKKVSLANNEKCIAVKKSVSDNSVAGKHHNDMSEEDESPPFKKMKINDNVGASKSKVKLKAKKSLTKIFKLRNSSLKKGISLSRGKTSTAKAKLIKKVTIGIKRGVGRPKKIHKKVSLKVGRKPRKPKDIPDTSEDVAEISKPKASSRAKSRSPSRENEKVTIKEKPMLPIKKKYRKEYFSESENTSGKEDDDTHVHVIKNPKKAFRDKWKREMKQKNKAEKNKLKEKPSCIIETDKKQRREQKPRAVTFDMSKTYDFAYSEDEADKDTDSERESIQTKSYQKKKGTKRKQPLDTTPLRRTARMASLNAIAMMHCMNEDAKISFSSSVNKEELSVVKRAESTIARRHSDSDSDDSESDTNRHEKSARGRQRKKAKDTYVDKPPKKMGRRRNELGVTMDIREMVVKKRMASLNASAIMAASYSLESRNRRIPTSYSSENDATDVDIKQKISYHTTKEENLKTRSVITVQETTKKIKKAQGRRETEVEERIIFKKKVKRQSGVDSTDTEKDDETVTDLSEETEVELLPKTPDSGMMIESTITYVTTQTLTMPKAPSGNNKYCLSSPNNKTTIVQHVSKKSTASTSSPPNVQPKPQSTHIGQEIPSNNQHSFNPAEKYSPLGALSEMHPIMHPHLPPHHALPYPPQHHMLPPQQQHEVPPYHHLGSHAMPPNMGPHISLTSLGHHSSQYPPLSPHSPPYPPPSKSSPAMPSPSSTPHNYGSPPRSSPIATVSQISSLPKNTNYTAPVPPPHNVPSQEKNPETPHAVLEERSQVVNRSQGGTPNFEDRHHSAFTAPTPSALSPVASTHGYQPVSGPMPTGNIPSSSSYKPPQQGSPIPSYGPSSPRLMGPAKQYKHEYCPVPRHPTYHGHTYPYNKYLRGPPYPFYQHHYPPGGQFGTPGEYNYSAPPAGSMHCSQEYAYTLCIPGPHPQSHHQPLALPAPSSSSAQPNAGPQYYHYPEYPPVFAYPSSGQPGQNAICCSPPRSVPPLTTGKGPEGENREAWGSGHPPPPPPPYNYQFYNPPNSHSFPPYAPHLHHSTNRMSHFDKNITQRSVGGDAPSGKREPIDSGLDSGSNINSVTNAATPPETTCLSKLSTSDDNANQNGVPVVNCKQADTDCKAPISISDSISSREPENCSKLSNIETSSDVVEDDTKNILKVADSYAKTSASESSVDAHKISKFNHIVPLPSASNKSVTVPQTQNLVTNDHPPWMCPVSSSIGEISRNPLENSLSKSNCSDFLYTATTATISLSSSETQCNSVKSSTNPLVTSAEVNNCQDRTDFSSTNGSSSVLLNNVSDHRSQLDKGAGSSPDNIKEPKIPNPDQRTGVRHLLCQSQPLSHSKSTSVLVKAKPSNIVSSKSVANADKKKDASLEKSTNFTISGPKNYYARSSETPTEQPTDKTSVGMKEGRNLTQLKKRGRPPKAKNSEHVKDDAISSGDSSLFLQSAQTQKHNLGSSLNTNQQLPKTLDQNLNTVSSEASLIKGTAHNIFKMESSGSVKIEDIPNNGGEEIALKSVNGGFSKLYENLIECDLKNRFTPISSEKLLERMSTMKQEEDNLPVDISTDIELGNPKMNAVVKELHSAHFMKEFKFRPKTGKVGRPTKKTLVGKLRRKVSLLSFLKEKNNESDNSVDMDNRICIDDDISPDKSDTAMKRVSVPFPPTSAQLQRKRRCSGLMKNKVTKKPKYCHGWSWQGDAHDGKVWLRNDENLFPRKCYMAMKHNQGDCLQVRDCVLLRSGTRRTDLPYVAKIAALWEDPDTSDMMMSILWYYRPEHTEYGRRPEDLADEIFASKHRDHLSVACIEDRCYVLTYNEYCRYRRKLRLFQMSVNPSSSPVPQGDEEYLRVERQPNGCVVQDLLFVCKKVYDYRQRRILKNPG